LQEGEDEGEGVDEYGAGEEGGGRGERRRTTRETKHKARHKGARWNLEPLSSSREPQAEFFKSCPPFI